MQGIEEIEKVFQIPLSALTVIERDGDNREEHPLGREQAVAREIEEHQSAHETDKL